MVAGGPLRYPRDPAGPPGETINCGCQSLPWMEEWDVAQPGRQPLTPEERAAKPYLADVLAAEREAAGPIPILDETRVRVRQTGPQAGSNPGGRYEGADGVERYVKFYDDPAQAYGEAVANLAYRELGLDAPASVLIRRQGKVVGIASEIVDSRGALGDRKRLTRTRARKVLRGYAADVWLRNWDAVGASLDNIVLTGARLDGVARIDQGGALLSRARGARKRGDAADVSEWSRFSDPVVNPSYSRVFRAAGVGDGDALGQGALTQIRAIEKLRARTSDFADLVPAVQGVAAADRDAILDMLRAREAALKDKVAPAIRKAMREARAKGEVKPHYIAYQKANRDYTDDLKGVTARRAPRRGMVDQLLVAMYSYTRVGFMPLNSRLRSGDPNKIASVAAFRDTLNDALDKLPDRPGVTRRGTNLPADVLARYQPGQVVTELGFTSTGKPFNGNELFKIHGKHGKLVQPYSAHPSEEEVLFRSGTKFVVLDRRTVQVEGSTQIRIALEEID